MKNMIKAISNEQKQRLTDFINTINEVNDITGINTWQYNDLLPKSKKMSSFNTLHEAKIYLIARKEKAVYKEIERQVSKIEAVKNAGTLIEIKISVEWKKSAMWGMNPTAEAWVQFINNEGQTDSMRFNSGSIGGCGYDKLSTAIANVLNQSNEVLKPLYEVKEKKIKANNRDLFGYGSGYGIKPSFEGGVGVSCYPDIFKKIGFKFKSVASGKTFDVYTVTQL